MLIVWPSLSENSGFDCWMWPKIINIIIFGQHAIDCWWQIMKMKQIFFFSWNENWISFESASDVIEMNFTWINCIRLCSKCSSQHILCYYRYLLGLFLLIYASCSSFSYHGLFARGNRHYIHFWNAFIAIKLLKRIVNESELRHNATLDAVIILYRLCLLQHLLWYVININAR